MDEVIRDIQGDVPWYLLLTNDVMLVDDSQTGVTRKLEHLQPLRAPRGRDSAAWGPTGEKKARGNLGFQPRPHPAGHTRRETGRRKDSLFSCTWWALQKKRGERGGRLTGGVCACKNSAGRPPEAGFGLGSPELVLAKSGAKRRPGGATGRFF